jgi:ankyrin repeat protein
MKKLFSILIPIIFLINAGCKKQDNPVPDIDLHTAVLTDNLDAIRQHIKAGSDLNIVEPTRESTPLITAAALGRQEAAEILFEGGADINYQNADGSTALHTAIAFGKTELADMLIDAGIDLNIKNKDGSTALHTAAFFCNRAVVEALLVKEADKTLLNKNYKTAYDIVEPPFEDAKDAYDAVGERLKPLGIILDYEHIKTTRPIIAEMLK